MSKIGKASLLIAGLFILGAGVTRLVLNMWHPSLWVPVVIALAFFAIAIFKDGRTYLEFFTMRTTKHGMNMGTLILLSLVLLATVNYIAVRNDKKWDWTKEGLNSLSDQSIKAAQAINEDLKVILLANRDQQDANIRSFVETQISKYKDVNKKISFISYNARQRPDLAQKLGFTGGEFGIFMEYKGKTTKVSEPTEEGITRALLSLDRQNQKTVYLTTGHGERKLEAPEAPGISQAKLDLETNYVVKELKLIETPKIPQDAAMVALIGPTQQLLESELQTLRDYAKSGGRLLIAVDPGQRHNLAQLTKTFGVELKNNYILDQRASVPGMGNVAALGTGFSSESAITKEVPKDSYTVMVLTTAMAKAPDAAPSLRVDEIVRTDAAAVSTNQLSAEVRPEGRGPFTLAVSVEGKVADAGNDAPEFAAVIFGDSDFMSNALYRQNLNRDIVMNTFSYLAKDNNLISIRPKLPEGTVLQMTRQKLLGIILCFLIPLPILMFGTGGFIWWRRKTA